MRRSLRRPLALLALPLLVLAPRAWAQDPPEDDAAVSEVERDEEAPSKERLPALPEPPPAFPVAGEGAEAWFVRLRAARIGGDFDSAAAEEVHVFAELGGVERTLAAAVIELGDELGDHAFPDAPWLELPAPAGQALALSVREEDVTNWEDMADAAEPLTLAPAAFGAGSPRPARVALEAIEGSRWSFFGGTRKISLPGGALELELVRAPRRDARDAELRAAVREAFGALPGRPRPRTAADAVRVEVWVRDAAIAAMRTARRSLHTRLRAELPALAREAYQLAGLARAVGRAAVDSEPLRARLRRLAAAARRAQADPSLAAHATRAAELARRPLPDELGDEALDALEALQADLEPVRQAVRDATAPEAPGHLLRKHAEALAGELRAILAGYAARPELARAWETFAGRVEAALAE